ncbi:MAG TPA: ATP-binding protein, partial [Bacteroidia bacterium]|nr:ATP-binding protein [Bacteroidia bacterium]
MDKSIFNWSGGKDSAFCLHKILEQKEYEVQCLLTSVNKQFQRISMHGVRVGLLHKQAESIGIPLVKLELPEMPDMQTYDGEMRKMLEELKRNGATHSIFGDIFLEDLRKYREDRLSEAGLKGVFP